MMQVRLENKLLVKTGLVDRRGWPDGPWNREPDLVVWVDEEMDWLCAIRRNRLGNWCGYITIPPPHPWHGVDSGADPDVHGGLTFEGERESGGDWWIGFDCAHYLDSMPGMGSAVSDGTIYRDLKYVTDECVRLARQARDVWMGVLEGRG